VFRSPRRNEAVPPKRFFRRPSMTVPDRAARSERTSPRLRRRGSDQLFLRFVYPLARDGWLGPPGRDGVPTSGGIAASAGLLGDGNPAVRKRTCTFGTEPPPQLRHSGLPRDIGRSGRKRLPGGSYLCPPRSRITSAGQLWLGKTEGEGFEPSSDETARNGFRDRRIRPLCHPSADPYGQSNRVAATPLGRDAPPVAAGAGLRPAGGETPTARKQRGKGGLMGETRFPP
jgi:hypothetical protein